MYSSFIFTLAAASAFMSIAFLPNLASDLGASDFQLGLIVSVYGLTSFISYYLFGRWGDIHGVRKVLQLGLLVAIIAFAIQVFAVNPTSLFFVRAAAGFAYGMVPAALIAYAHHTKQQMGKISSYESMGWLLGSIFASILSLANPISPYRIIFLVSSLLFAIGFAASLKLPKYHIPLHRVPLFPWNLIRENFSVYLAFFLRHFGAMIVWTFFSLFLWELGASFFWIGIINAANVGVQTLVKPWLDRFNPWRIFRVGLFLSAIVFYSYTLAPNFWYIIPVQMLLGIAWSSMQVGALTILVDNNLEHSTVVGLFYSTFGLASILAPLFAGILLAFWGFHGAMYVASGFALIGFLASYAKK
ncbi:MAG: MFS transporter [Candidatus Altiarchaeota archaeon]